MTVKDLKDIVNGIPSREDSRPVELCGSLLREEYRTDAGTFENFEISWIDVSNCILICINDEKWDLSKKITKIGVNWIIEQIKEKAIYPPGDMTARELAAWLNGYRQAQSDALDILAHIGEQMK